MYEKASESRAPAAMARVSSFKVSADISPPVGPLGNGAAGSEKNGPDRRCCYNTFVLIQGEKRAISPQKSPAIEILATEVTATKGTKSIYVDGPPTWTQDQKGTPCIGPGE